MTWRQQPFRTKMFCLCHPTQRPLSTRSVASVTGAVNFSSHLIVVNLNGHPCPVAPTSDSTAAETVPTFPARSAAKASSPQVAMLFNAPPPTRWPLPGPCPPTAPAHPQPLPSHLLPGLPNTQLSSHPKCGTVLKGSGFGGLIKIPLPPLPNEVIIKPCW